MATARRLPVLAAALVPATIAATAPAHAAAERILAAGDPSREQVVYRIERGETLIGLARAHFRNPADWRKVQRLNRIRNPHRIPVGTPLAIPFSLLSWRPAKAEVAAFRAPAEIARSGASLLPAARGLAVAEGDALHTGPAGSLSLALEDGTTVTLPSRSRLRLERLRFVTLTGSIDYGFALDEGGARTRAAPLRSPAGRHRIRTPRAVSAVRGTEFRTRIEGAEESFAEVLEGSIALAAGTTEINLPVGQGSIASSAGVVTEALLPAPEPASAIGTQRDPEVTFTMAPQPGVVGWRAVIARDAGLLEVEREVRSDDPVLRIGPLDNGSWFAAVTAIAASGLEGLPNVIAFRRRLNALSGSAGPGDDGFRFAWSSAGDGARHFRFQLWRLAPGAALPAGAPWVDEPGLEATAISVGDLPAGRYAWRVGTVTIADGEADTNWTEIQQVTIGE